jgi:hypothetical protein
MLLIGYCLGIRSERQLCEEVRLNLAYRWFCRLSITDAVPDHSTFSKNRHGRFRESEAFRYVFEQVLKRCIEAGLVKGEGFAVDASVVKADAAGNTSTRMTMTGAAAQACASIWKGSMPRRRHRRRHQGAFHPLIQRHAGRPRPVGRRHCSCRTPASSSRSWATSVCCSPRPSCATATGGSCLRSR